MDNTKGDVSAARSRPNLEFWRSSVPFWLWVWYGTTMAGWVFGFLLGCSGAGLVAGFCGSVVGMICACPLGAFTIANVAVVSWCFSLSRFRLAMAGIAGGLTGISATLIVALYVAPPIAFGSWELGALAAQAGLVGTLGGWVAGYRYHSWAKAQGERHQGTSRGPPEL